MTTNAEIPPTAPLSPIPFVRPVEGRMVAGVCAGIARRWQIDVTLVRVVAVVLALFNGVGIALYIAVWLLTPSTDAAAPLRPGGKMSDLARRVPPIVLVLLGIAVVASVMHSMWSGAPALAVLAVIVAVAVTTRRGRVVTLAVLLMLVASLTAFGVFGDRMGSRDLRVASASELRTHYDYGAGRLRLDLSGMQVSGAHRTEIRLGRGDAVITLPRDGSVTVHARTGIGTVTIDGHRVRGIGAEQTRDVDGATADGRLVVDVLVGAGDVEVNRA